MAMNKVARMAMEAMRKSMPSKPMNRKDAQRVEKAIRENPKLYRKLSPHQVLDMLDMPKITGKKIVNKNFGGLMRGIGKGVKAIKDKVNKKDSKGNTISIFGKPSANQQKTKKAIKQTRTTRVEKLKSLGKGSAITGGAIYGANTIGDKSKAKAPEINKKPKATKKAIPTKTPTPRPKKKMYMKEKSGKDSNVEFGIGKTKKKLFGGGKVGGMKSGSATPNRLY